MGAFAIAKFILFELGDESGVMTYPKMDITANRTINPMETAPRGFFRIFQKAEDLIVRLPSRVQLRASINRGSSL